LLFIVVAFHCCERIDPRSFGRSMIAPIRAAAGNMSHLLYVYMTYVKNNVYADAFLAYSLSACVIGD
jgi:hypothetical protein